MASSSNYAATPTSKSPIPYLFSGLALMLILIATALIILACSHKKRSRSISSQDEEKSVLKKRVIEPLDMEPKIVVIMAGDANPSFIAKPLSVASFPVPPI